MTVPFRAIIAMIASDPPLRGQFLVNPSSTAAAQGWILREPGLHVLYELALHYARAPWLSDPCHAPPPMSVTEPRLADQARGLLSDAPYQMPRVEASQGGRGRPVRQQAGRGGRDAGLQHLPGRRGRGDRARHRGGRHGRGLHRRRLEWRLPDHAGRGADHPRGREGRGGGEAGRGGNNAGLQHLPGRERRGLSQRAGGGQRAGGAPRRQHHLDDLADRGRGASGQRRPATV